MIGLEEPSSLADSIDLFVYPGYSFRAVEAMIVSFHLPAAPC